MSNFVKVLVAVVASLMIAAHADTQTEIFKVAEEASNLLSMSVIKLREGNCGGNLTQGHQDAKNAKFVGCVMYVLGVVDLLREWQRIDPANAPSACVPRNATSGELVTVVHDYIEATAPWREQQDDATTAVIRALKEKWPCSNIRR